MFQIKSFTIALLLASLLCIPPPIVTSLSATPTSKASSNMISVWDNVVPESTCELLHKEASNLGLGHFVFARPLSSSYTRKNNVIEHVLDSILTQLEEEQDEEKRSKYVEYWTRREWRHIEAHADVDEHLAKKQDQQLLSGEKLNKEEYKFRYPQKGHVLYLKVGTQVHGPTCVFPGVTTGGDLKNSNDNGEVELVTVPAVQGRVLQFQGNLLHAVPRPADLWTLSFVKGSPQFEPEEEWGRSVILFNLWDEEPPLDVPFDERDDEVKRGGFGDDDGDNVECRPHGEWKQVYSLSSSANDDNSDDSCRDDDSAREEGEEAISKNIRTKIWLLGNPRRRNHSDRNVRLLGPESLKDALHQTHVVSKITLGQS